MEARFAFNVCLSGMLPFLDRTADAGGSIDGAIHSRLASAECTQRVASGARSAAPSADSDDRVPGVYCVSLSNDDALTATDNNRGWSWRVVLCGPSDPAGACQKCVRGSAGRQCASGRDRPRSAVRVSLSRDASGAAIGASGVG